MNLLQISHISNHHYSNLFFNRTDFKCMGDMVCFWWTFSSMHEHDLLLCFHSHPSEFNQRGARCKQWCTKGVFQTSGVGGKGNGIMDPERDEPSDRWSVNWYRGIAFCRTYYYFNEADGSVFRSIELVLNRKAALGPKQHDDQFSNMQLRNPATNVVKTYLQDILHRGT